MYKVTYSRPVNYNRVAVSKPLPFGWALGSVTDYKTLEDNRRWALYAKTVFDEVETMPRLEAINHFTSPTQGSIDEKLEILKIFGYSDVELNLNVLKENDFNTGRTVQVLSQRNFIESVRLKNELAATANKSESESEGSSYHSSTDEDEPKERQPSTSKTRPQKKSLPPPEPIEEDCSICCNKYPKTSNNWKTLPKCQHKLCVDCYKKIEITRTTMSGSSHTFIKCPFCLITSGIEIGICPDGEMSERFTLTNCDGYENCGSISFLYNVNTPLYRLTRGAFLPNNEEGRNILKLLRIAWDRRIVFTIDTSHTTGRENTLVWNIHHKTSQTGGVYCHGYPDPTYLKRVKAELKSFGIE